MSSSSAIATGGSRHELFGISTALVTPFADDGSVDTEIALAHVRDVLARGARSVTLFGTTGEGASLGMSDRRALVDAIHAGGIAAEQTVVAVCATSIEQAVDQALEAGTRRLLVTPPFYFKGVSDGALFDWFSAFAQAIAEIRPEIILYHIPQVTQVGLSVPLIRRLKDRFGDMIFGVKDSSGSWENARALLQYDDLAILIGDERQLAKAAPLGCAGSISGMANLFPAELDHMLRTGADNPGLCALVDEIVTMPVTPAVKALVARRLDMQQWRRVRSPLDPATDADIARLARLLPATLPQGAI